MPDTNLLTIVNLGSSVTHAIVLAALLVVALVVVRPRSGRAGWLIVGAVSAMIVARGVSFVIPVIGLRLVDGDHFLRVHALASVAATLVSLVGWVALIGGIVALAAAAPVGQSSALPEP